MHLESNGNVPEVGSDALFCPFCGAAPTVGPEYPEESGNAWGYVVCENKQCGARPRVEAHEDSLSGDDENGTWLNTSDEIKAEAVKRWNVRQNATEQP